ncbi:MAG: hypothetical protein RL181_2799 [Bacteroidota bacterium]|jgi:hypothetical protein
MRYLSAVRHGLSLNLLILLFSSCQQDAPDKNPGLDTSQLGVERIEQVEIIYSDSAVVRVRISGPLMLNHLQASNPFQEFPRGLKVEFFNPFGLVSSVMTAKYAVRYPSTGLTYIRDEVVWRSTEQKTLETPELTWDEREKKVFTQKFAVVTTLVDTVYSHGFQAGQDFRDIKLNAIDGSMNVQEGQQPGTAN